MDVSLTEVTTRRFATACGAEQLYMIEQVRHALDRALRDESQLDPNALAIRGMSGRKYRHFINNLIRALPDPHYLEVGSWAGSTLCAAVNGNAVKATAIDNWSEFGGPKQEFSTNLARFVTADAHVGFIEADFRRVDFARLGSFNVYLFDGPHEMEDQFDGVAMARPALDPYFVLIVDDWNWQRVRDGTLQALSRLQLRTLYMVEIRTTLDDTHPAVAFQHSDWHNGYFIGVIEQ